MTCSTTSKKVAFMDNTLKQNLIELRYQHNFDNDHHMIDPLPLEEGWKVRVMFPEKDTDPTANRIRIEEVTILSDIDD